MAYSTHSLQWFHTPTIFLRPCTLSPLQRTSTLSMLLRAFTLTPALCCSLTPQILHLLPCLTPQVLCLLPSLTPQIICRLPNLTLLAVQPDSTDYLPVTQNTSTKVELLSADGAGTAKFSFFSHVWHGLVVWPQDPTSSRLVRVLFC